jgi:DNA-binding MurR/RpiR family transcriptional regulator
VPVACRFDRMHLATHPSQTETVEQFLARVRAEFAHLSPQLQTIARYFEQNRASVTVDRVQAIAANCGVQASAVVRFAQRFGFNGFSDLQALYRNEFTHRASPAQSYRHRIRNLLEAGRTPMRPVDIGRELIAASIAGLQEQAGKLDAAALEAAVSRLAKAQSIYIAAVRRSFPAATYLAYAMQHTAKPVHLLSGLGGMLHDEIRAIGKRDVLVAISFQPYGRETQYCVRAAHARGASVIAISDGQLSPIAQHGDVVLTVTEGTAFAFRSLTSTISLCQMLFIAVAARLELDLSQTHAHDKDETDD